MFGTNDYNKKAGNPAVWQRIRPEGHKGMQRLAAL